MHEENLKILTDLVRIAMLLEEEKIACFIFAVYNVNINYEVIYEAVRLNYYELLHFIWIFEKDGNFLIHTEITNFL